MSETACILKDIHKSYPAPEGRQEVRILRGIDLAVESGDALAIVGPSGSGKSTLLNIMGCLDKPDKGTVTIAGRDVTGCSHRELAEIRNRQLGFIFQSHYLLAQCSALENVLVPTLALRKGERGGDHLELAKSLLKRVGLADRLTYRPPQLSGGESLRVAVARSLINKPRLLLADEPTGSLDAKTSEKLADLLLDLNRADGVTLVVVTHSRELAERIGRIYQLRDGVLHG
jgi:ABC-type lipoprotein export system ATPase subunit